MLFLQCLVQEVLSVDDCYPHNACLARVIITESSRSAPNFILSIYIRSGALARELDVFRKEMLHLSPYAQHFIFAYRPQRLTMNAEFLGEVCRNSKTS